MSPHPAPPPHEHLFHPGGVAAAGKAAREAGRPHLVGCTLCGESVQLGVSDEAPRRRWTGPATSWPALQPGFVRPD